MTIHAFQDFFGQCNHTRVYAFRKPPGFGLVCHPRLKKICELLGIKDIYVKTEGSTNNYYTLLKAFLTGLQHQETYQQLAERTRLHVVELDRKGIEELFHHDSDKQTLFSSGQHVPSKGGGLPTAESGERGG